MRRNVTGFAGVLMMLAAAGCDRGPSPQNTFAEFQAAMKAQDIEKVWALLSPSTRDGLTTHAESAARLASHGASSKDKNMREMAQAEAERYGIPLSELKSLDARKYLWVLLNAGRQGKLGPEGAHVPVLVEGELQGVDIKLPAKTWATATVFRGDTAKYSVEFEREKDGDPWLVHFPEYQHRK